MGFALKFYKRKIVIFLQKYSFSGLKVMGFFPCFLLLLLLSFLPWAICSFFPSFSVFCCFLGFFSTFIPSSFPFQTVFLNATMEKQFLTASSSCCGCCTSCYQILDLAALVHVHLGNCTGAERSKCFFSQRSVLFLPCLVSKDMLPQPADPSKVP